MNKKRKPSKVDLENALRKNLKKKILQKNLLKKMILSDKQIKNFQKKSK